MVLAAGVAQADVSFSGTAGVALIDDNGASMAAASGDQRAALVAAERAAINADTNADTVAAGDGAETAAVQSSNDDAAAATDAAMDAATDALAAYDADPAGTNTAAAATARASRADMFFESYYDLNITASAESDNGVSVSVGFDDWHYYAIDFAKQTASLASPYNILVAILSDAYVVDRKWVSSSSMSDRRDL